MMKKVIAAFFVFSHNRNRWGIQKEEGQMAGIVLEKIIEMAVILLCGVLAYKTGLIDKASTKMLFECPFNAGVTAFGFSIVSDGL